MKVDRALREWVLAPSDDVIDVDGSVRRHRQAFLDLLQAAEQDAEVAEQLPEPWRSWLRQGFGEKEPS